MWKHCIPLPERCFHTNAEGKLDIRSRCPYFLLIREQATTPVVVMVLTSIAGLSHPSSNQLFNVVIIVFGVVLATFGEIKFELVGFLVQCGGIVFEGIRLVLVQKLLSGSEHKMDPLVSLYYFAPLCACMNGVLALFFEVPSLRMTDIHDVGIGVLILNALVAFGLNVSVVFLVSYSARNHDFLVS